MAKNKGINSGSEYTVSYGNFRGVDRNSDSSEVSSVRLSYSENMYRDYDGENAGAVESIPGFRQLFSFNGAIRGIYSQKCKDGTEYLLVHSGTSLYRLPLSEIDTAENMEFLGTLADVKSHGFAVKDNLFILDGEGIHKVDGNGAFITVCNGSEDVYIPTTYINGTHFEQRNLLTDRFSEEYLVSDPYLFCHGTRELRYTVTDSDLLHCAVSGIEESFSGAVYIPKYVNMSGRVYSVKAIQDSAFDGNTKITSVKIAEGVEKIGKYAFRSSAITRAVMSSTVREIGAHAFSRCAKLVEFFLGGKTELIGASAFEGSNGLSEVHYAGNDDDFLLIGNTDELSDMNIIFNSEDSTVRIELPISDKAKSIDSVLVDGESVSFMPVYKNDFLLSVIMSFDGEWCISGKKVKLSGILAPYSSDFSGKSSSFLDTDDGILIGGFSAVSGCRIAESFDGRIFFAGNPALPNTVFFTERDKTGENNPLYFGAMNYFNDGSGSYDTIAMLSVRDALAVFKAGDDGSGSIFYHVGAETNDSVVPKAYPVSYIHSGISAKGAALSFFDDAVFLSDVGLSALEHKSINYERSIGCRSHNVNRDLLQEDLSSASMCTWLGYLAIGVNGTVYLADSRATFIHETQNTEYEWFIVKGVGTYKSDKRVFVYSSIAPPGFSVHKNADKRCTSTVYSVFQNEDLLLYTPEDGINYSVNPTGEWTGGNFTPATIFFSHGDLLFFGTDMGDLCVFNNDKRGIAPDRIRFGKNYDEEEYTRDMGKRIHPDFYSFVNHSPRYAISTKLDNCGSPHLSKNTVKHSLVVKCKSYGSSEIHLEAGTDRSGYKEISTFSGGEADFSNIDFSTITLERDGYYSLPFAEKEKGWIEKQLTLYSDTFRSPIQIYSLSYRYRLKGKIERR